MSHTPSHCRLDREAPCRERQTFRSTYSGGGGRKREGWDSGGMEEKTGKVRIRGRRQGNAALAVSLDDT